MHRFNEYRRLRDARVLLVLAVLVCIVGWVALGILLLTAAR